MAGAFKVCEGVSNKRRDRSNKLVKTIHEGIRLCIQYLKIKTNRFFFYI